MLNRNRLLLLIALMMSLALPTWAQDDDPIILAVNGDTISGEDFFSRHQFEYALTEQLAQFRADSIAQQAQQFDIDPQQLAVRDTQFQQWVQDLANPEALASGVLDSMVNELLIRQYAAENGIEVTDADVDAAFNAFFGFDPAVADEATTAAFNEVRDQFVGSITAVANESELDNFFAYRALLDKVRVDVVSERNEFVFAEVSHILVDTTAEGEEILGLLDEGADFATLAQERSIDTGSGARGGDLGEAPLALYVEPFANAARDAELNTIVGPVESGFGQHILIVRSRETRAADAQMLGRLEDVVLRGWIEDLIAEAEVERDDAWMNFIYVPDELPQIQVGSVIDEAPIPAEALTRYANIEASTNEDGYALLGDPDAPITVYEYSSFSCPACVSWHDAVFPALLPRIEAGEINFVYIPLMAGSIPNPDTAYVAAYCAGQQGFFWEMHDALFSWHVNYGSTAFEPARILIGAVELELDGEAFITCFTDPASADPILQAADLANANGVTGTPTIFVNDQRLQASNLDAVEAAIEAAQAD